MEKTGVPSVPVPEESRAGGLPYVLTDIMTYFTMLVGIYFPSVTGEPATRSACSPRPHPVPVLSHCWAQAMSPGSLLPAFLSRGSGSCVV